MYSFDNFSRQPDSSSSPRSSNSNHNDDKDNILGQNLTEKVTVSKCRSVIGYAALIKKKKRYFELNKTIIARNRKMSVFVSYLKLLLWAKSINIFLISPQRNIFIGTDKALFSSKKC